MKCPPGRLVQDPLWGYFFLGPVIVYTLDKLVSISRNKLEISVKSATLLPSGTVTVMMMIMMMMVVVVVTIVMTTVVFRGSHLHAGQTGVHLQNKLDISVESATFLPSGMVTKMMMMVVLMVLMMVMVMGDGDGDDDDDDDGNGGGSHLRTGQTGVHLQNKLDISVETATFLPSGTVTVMMMMVVVLMVLMMVMVMMVMMVMVMMMMMMVMVVVVIYVLSKLVSIIRNKL